MDFKRSIRRSCLLSILGVLFMATIGVQPVVGKGDAQRLVCYDFPIQGYALQAAEKLSMDWDEQGNISLRQRKPGAVDVDLQLKQGQWHFADIPVEAAIMEDPDGNPVQEFDISDPCQGFFLIIIMARNQVFIDLACDGGDAQLCYQALLPYGFATLESLSPQTGNMQVPQKMNRTSVVPFLPGGEPLPQMQEKLFERLRNGIHVVPLKPGAGRAFGQNPTSSQVLMSGAGMNGAAVIPVYRYGIVFEGYDSVYDFISFPERLPKEWEGTGIDYGIYRSGPSKSQIRSDLSYYNKYWYSHTLNRGYDRNIVAYCSYVIGRHPEMNPSIQGTSWKTGADQWLQPSEVKSLWGEGTKYEWPNGKTSYAVYPKGMIILTMACYGYSLEKESPPYMGQAFVNVYDKQGRHAGAEAFMGIAGDTMLVQTRWEPPPDHPDFDPENPFQLWDNDVFVSPFWMSMTVGEYSIGEAAVLFCSHHNYYAEYAANCQYHRRYSYGFQNGQWGNIRILGNANAKLPPY